MTAKQILPASKGFVEHALAWLWTFYSYEPDQSRYGKPEFWQGALLQFSSTGTVSDDCDGFSRFMIAVLRFGGFGADEVAELVTDTNAQDTQPYDHHICAVKVNGRWMYAHCWAKELLTRKQLEGGYYDTYLGSDATGMEIVGHRLVSRQNFNVNSKKGWLTGPPK